MRRNPTTNGGARAVVDRRLCLLIAAALGSGVGVACSDAATGARGPVPPVPGAAAGSFVVASSGTPAASTVYVSLPPGAIPGGGAARLRVVRTGATAAADVVAGGFDPVALGAVVGDTIAIEVRAADTVLAYAVAVPRPNRPVVVRTSPPAHKRDVPLNATVVVVFSEPMDPATLTGAAIQLRRGGAAVDGTLAFVDAAHLTAEFVPSAPLDGNTDYELTIAQGIRDVGGLGLEAGLSVPFTTAVAATPPDTTPAAPPSTSPFPALSRSGEIYTETTNVYAAYGSGITSRYVLYADGTFALQFFRADRGFFEYLGRYATNRDAIGFDWDGWSSAGPWGAGGVLRGDTLQVAYNFVMQMSDFVDGVYVRAPGAPSNPSTSSTDAALVVTAFTLLEIESPSQPGSFSYAPQIQVAESGGRSAATITRMLFTLADDLRSLVQICSTGTVVPAGGRADLIAETYGDYELEFSSGARMTNGSPMVRIDFHDDAGRTGTVVAQGAIVPGGEPTTYTGGVAAHASQYSVTAPNASCAPK